MNGFRQEETILRDLAALYERRGYIKYRPSCFEEYALYLDNRDFLISKNVIAFSGADGRLLALRPDVTLSIIHRIKADAEHTQKLYYTEKVYRQTSPGGDFKEISQTGVEIIGNIDTVCQTEAMILILDTLAAVSSDYLLDVSHMGFIEGLISSFPCDDAQKRKFYTYLCNKNAHDFERDTARCNLSCEQRKAFVALIGAGGDPVVSVRRMKEIAVNQRMLAAAQELEELIGTLTALGYGGKINLNFSIVNDADYYNGVIFNGYIDGVPHSVLSGGRYDRLLQKFGKESENGSAEESKRAGAIGFALYLGELERYFRSEKSFVDVLALYDDESQKRALEFAVGQNRAGRSVRLSRNLPVGLHYGELVDLTKGGACHD